MFSYPRHGCPQARDESKKHDRNAAIPNSVRPSDRVFIVTPSPVPSPRFRACSAISAGPSAHRRPPSGPLAQPRHHPTAGLSRCRRPAASPCRGAAPAYHAVITPARLPLSQPRFRRPRMNSLKNAPGPLTSTTRQCSRASSDCEQGCEERGAGGDDRHQRRSSPQAWRSMSCVEYSSPLSFATARCMRQS